MKGLQEFKNKFGLLNKIEQNFLSILATAYETMTVKNFYTILTNASIHNAQGRTISIREVELLVVNLKEKGWVETPSLGEFHCVATYEKHLLQEAFDSNQFPLFLMAIREVLPTKERSWMRKPRNFHVCIRELQIALLQKNIEEFHTWLTAIKQYYPGKLTQNSSLAFLFEDHFEPDWIASFPDDFQYQVLENIIFQNIRTLRSIDTYVSYLETHPEIDNKSAISKQYRSLLGNAYIFQGKIKGKDIFFKNYARMAWVAFLMGDNADAIQLFEKALDSLYKISGHKNIYFYHAAGPFYILALLKQGHTADHSKILNYCKLGAAGLFGNTYGYLSTIIYQLQNNPSKIEILLNIVPQSSVEWLFKALVTYWLGEDLSKKEVNYLKDLYQKSKEANLQWISLELASILAEFETTPSLANTYRKTAKKLEKATGLISIINSQKVIEKWAGALQALKTIPKKQETQIERQKKATRLVWLVDMEHEIIQAKEQTLNKTGSWSKGKNVALKRLVQADVVSMSEQDHRIANKIKRSSYGYYGAEEYTIDFKEAILEMVGHPAIFRHDNAAIPIEINSGKPELLVDEKDGFFEFYFAHPIDTIGINIHRETPTRYIVLEIEKEHEQVANIIGRRLKVPHEAKDQVLEAIKNITGLIEVQSAVFGEDENIVQKAGDSTIHAHLLPFGDGFKLEFFVKPLLTLPPYFKPGLGRSRFVTHIEGAKTVVERNLEQEQIQLQQLLAACPSLEETTEFEGEFTFEEVSTCLQILLELEPFRSEKQIVIEWPKGGEIKLTKQLGMDDFSMRIKRENNWFDVTGELQINEDLAMDMRHLLNLVSLNKGQEFIEIKDKQFIRLTDSFKAKLGELNSLVVNNKNDLQFHPLAAVAMESWAEEIGNLEVDLKWKAHLKQLREYRSTKPTVPASFKATLRPYQLEGFHWLSQLADWGVGACLADDMGLGKTIQGLALIVSRGDAGPSLVVAPASVANNWHKEIAKFAPTLTPLVFGPGDRAATLRNLKANDVLIMSYGLLQQASDLLKEKNFTTIVLDEAQAIKNRSAKRSRAAMELQGDFKVITTGTPIENHLGELWNLFNFLNPGLLGSIQSFQDRFAIPIEKQKDPFAQEALKRLLQPFILRRKKDDVLTDLPSKTEITLSVAMSEEEIAFYEVFRRKAVDNLTNSDEEAPQKRFQILAEIMRLRQACCHPKLVTPMVSIKSSKLELLGNILEDLIENGHKALIFSQFVGHLKIIEQHLQEQNIQYQYLDGSTPLKKRAKRIDAFQAGEGDVFLISLKAGGVGLNLTAADYVIHMDPWWNPAVEDQASDRAHRIGQTRPVTIYRLITENTIEEKIVKLHEHKRDLADSLLEGTDSSGKLSAEELLQLIQEQ